MVNYFLKKILNKKKKIILLLIISLISIQIVDTYKVQAETDASVLTPGTATEADILEGKTAWVNGTLLTGTIPVRDGLGNVVSDKAWLSNNRVYFGIESGYYKEETIGDLIGYTEKYITYASLASTIGITEKTLAYGQTILGITGTYSSDATATADKILSGKTAYVNGTKITGTLKNKGTINWNPTTGETKTIEAGYYSGGTLNTTTLYNSGYDAGLAEMNLVVLGTYNYTADRTKDVIVVGFAHGYTTSASGSTSFKVTVTRSNGTTETLLSKSESFTSSNKNAASSTYGTTVKATLNSGDTIAVSRSTGGYGGHYSWIIGAQ